MPSNKKKSKMVKGAPTALKGAPGEFFDPGTREKVTVNVPRWTMLILLAVGVSKLMDVRNASISTSDGHPSTTCLKFFGEEACQDGAISGLLKYKYQSALSVLLLVLAATLECLSSDRMLQLLQANLAFCLMLPAGLAFWASNGWIPSQIVWRQLMILAGLSLVAVPSRDTIPFLAKNTFPRETTLQSRTLVSLALFSLFACSQIVFPILTKGKIAGVIESLSIQTTSIAGITPILIFFGVDKLANAGIYAFSWYYFSNEQQRSFFFFHGVLKMIECLYQLPSVADVVPNLVQQQQFCMTVALASFICWKAPDLLQKNKLA
ncbi:hypothetical protein FisN_24Lh209 [Fistulifera solaris]|uniref:Uncharacterized protein n=1 Tax=Fistulifera solaris TaxID=1519565 RepID=A0A1Z5K9G3_FISSO|nr:hypothetical protein FisN_24Lh209 [Fistulifera solaris]|eukprot:GAX22920.1 hypothetical protein FisN_24Lh209 [Fistulifera solaris]